MFRNISIILLVLITHALGTVNLTGYSGAPGSLGTCAGKCHGMNGGTINVRGFPTTYVPGQTYNITVTHDAGSKISNFNASVRVGTTMKKAGTITAGYQTVTYNVAAESNGIHLATANNDTGKFYWTAPQSGVGTVNLYVSGMQGSTPGGKNTMLTLSSQQAKTYTATDTNKIIYLTIQVHPITITDSLVFDVTVPLEKSAEIIILQNEQKIISAIPIAASMTPIQSIAWKAINKDNKKLTNGSYFALLVCEKEQVVQKFSINNN